jgi:hypothetical protein
MRPRPPASQGLRAANTARDKDLEQFRRSLSAQKPPPKAAAAAGGAWAVATSESFSAPFGYPTFSDWTFESDDGVGLAASDDPAIFTVPDGLYMAKVYVQINVSPVHDDLWMSCNLFSASAYVTHEFPLNLAGSGYHFGSYSIGPLPVADGHGRMSVSFQFPFSAGTPSVDGSCAYILAKLA